MCKTNIFKYLNCPINCKKPDKIIPLEISGAEIKLLKESFNQIEKISLRESFKGN